MIEIPNGQQPPPMMLAQPFNDAQLISLVAAQSGLPPIDAVEWAVEIVAESVLAVQKLRDRIRAKQSLDS